MKTNLFNLACAALLLCAAGCAYSVKSSDYPMRKGSKIAVGAVINNSETALAAEKVRALLAARVKMRFGEESPAYQALPDDDISDSKAQEQALSWAAGQGAQYLLCATVEEWRYKNGLDGEPAVGVTLQLYDVDTGAPLWSASGAKTGWGRSSLAATGGKLLDRLLSALERPEK